METRHDRSRASRRARPSKAAPDRVDRLRARIRAIEGGGRSVADGVPLGIPAVDARLPGGGIVPGALHQIFAGDAAAGAATAFAAVLLGQQLRRRAGMALWCLRPRTIDGGAIYGPGLARFGLEPARLVIAQARRDADALWAIEEGLRCRDLVAVLGETTRITLTESRRLQLAAEASGVTALLLHPAAACPAPSAAASCWRVAAAPSLPDGFAAAAGAPGPERWHTALVRCRGGTTGAWWMEWDDETRDLALSAPVRDRADRRHRAATPA